MTARSNKVRFPVYRNPTPTELKNVQALDPERSWVGGLLTIDGDVYIWPREFAEHDDIIMNMPLDQSGRPLHFYVYPNGELSGYGGGPVLDEFPRWQEAPNIKAMMGEPAELQKAEHTLNEELAKRLDGEIWNSLRQRYIRKPYPVYENPTPQELQNVLDYPAETQYAGGLLTPDDRVYIWPRDMAFHDDVISDMGLSWDSLHFYVYQDRRLSAYDEGERPGWREAPNIKTMMGEPEEMEKTA
jgi:hypothetical protein